MVLRFLRTYDAIALVAELVVAIEVTPNDCKTDEDITENWQWQPKQQSRSAGANLRRATGGFEVQDFRNITI